MPGIKWATGLQGQLQPKALLGAGRDMCLSSTALLQRRPARPVAKRAFSMSCVIKSTSGKDIIVDEETFEYLSSLKIHTSSLGYPYVFEHGRVVYIYRKIIGANSSEKVDHINGNPLDNRKINLRVCSHAENMRNRKIISTKNTSGYKGVSYHTANKKWRAKIKLNGIDIHLGYFDNPVDAAKKYDDASRKYHGDFSKTNF